MKIRPEVLHLHINPLFAFWRQRVKHLFVAAIRK
jgi:hypothetical protein